MITVNGFDASMWNTVSDWQAVKADPKQYKFVFIKATEGTGYRANYQNQWDGAGSIGLLRSNYHFHRAAAGGAAQADYFLSWYKKGELPPVVDFEDVDGLKAQGGKAVFENLRGCLMQVEQKINQTPIVYTGLWFLQLLWANCPTYDSKWLADFPLWAADYTKSTPVGNEPLRPSWWPWKFYQWTSSGTISGIVGRVDLNVFNGSEADLRAWAGQPVVPPVITDAEKLTRLWDAHPELW